MVVGDILQKTARKGTSDKVTSEQRSGWSEGRHCVAIREIYPRWGLHKCRGCEVQAHLMCLRKGKEARGAEAE